MYAAGMSQVEVAGEIGVTQKVIWRLMIYHGIKTRPRIKRNQWRDKNANWKAGSAKYAALHLRVQSLRGKPHKCEVCGTDDTAKRYEWANMTGRYDDPSDYKRMCVSCHHKNDKTVRNLGAYALPKGVMPNARKD